MLVKKKSCQGFGMRYTAEEGKSQRTIIYSSIFHFNDFSNTLEIIGLF